MSPLSEQTDESSKKKYTYGKKYTVFKRRVTPCTCGRKNKDLEDCAALYEFFKRMYRANGEFVPSKMSHVVCTRPGCFGEWITNSPYVDKLPIIYYNEWLNQQKKSIKESPIEAKE